MRPFIATLLLLLSCAGLRAQDQPRTLGRLLFNAPGDTITGGYLALTGKGGRIMGEDAFFFGGRAGATVGHWFSFGVAFTGLTNRIRNPRYEAERTEAGMAHQDGLSWSAGYGGLFIEPALFSSALVHLSFPVSFGAGGIRYSYPKPQGDESGRITTDASTFFYVEPAVEVEVNIVRNVRLGLGASYLFTTDAHLPATGSRPLEQPYLQCSLKFGVF